MIGARETERRGLGAARGALLGCVAEGLGLLAVFAIVGALLLVGGR